METQFLVQKPNYKKAYTCLKNMCHREGIEYKKLPEDVKKAKIGFVIGSTIISILEVDNRVKL